MLKWAIILFLISLVAGALGFTNIAHGAKRIAQLLFVVFLLLCIIVLIIAWKAGEALL